MHNFICPYNLHTNEYSQGLRYYTFAVIYDRFVGSCNTLNNLSNDVCAPNKTKYLNFCVFNMIIGINEWKILTKHISCNCECKYDGRKCNSNQNWNKDKCWCECKNPKEHHVCKKYFTWNPATFSWKNDKYLASVINNSVITCGDITEKTKTVPAKSTPRKTVPTNGDSTNFYILPGFLILRTVSIYLIKHPSKQKHLLPNYVTNKKVVKPLSARI